VLGNVAWAWDGNGLFLYGDTPRAPALLYVDLDGRTSVLYEDPTGDLDFPTPSPDGRRFAFGRAVWDSNLWTIEDFSPR
jgi:Tol biopolymer transport system component